jgi:uncharacterized protein
MSDNENRKVIIAYWWEKANESLLSAEREFKASAFVFAVNRIYYAAFYGVCAVLLSKGVTFKKHSAVRSSFHSEFIKTGILSSEWGKYYDQLFRDRQEGDYIPLIEFDHSYIKTQLSRCKEFLGVLKPLLDDYI